MIRYLWVVSVKFVLSEFEAVKNLFKAHKNFLCEGIKPKDTPNSPLVFGVLNFSFITH